MPFVSGIQPNPYYTSVGLTRLSTSFKSSTLNNHFSVLFGLRSYLISPVRSVGGENVRLSTSLSGAEKKSIKTSFAFNIVRNPKIIDFRA